LVSVAGNWLHAWLPAAEHPAGWSPTLATQVGAAVWPVALLVAVEVLSRTPWPGGKAWGVVRIGGVGVVAAGSAVISYGHIHAVLKSWGYDNLGAGVGPLVIDGLMVISGFALLAMSGQATAPTNAKPEQDERPASSRKTASGTSSALPVKTGETPAPIVPKREATAPRVAPAAERATADRPGRDVPTVPASPSRPAPTGTSWEAMAEALKAQEEVSSEAALNFIRAYRDDTGGLPTAYLVKTRLGVGSTRAARLVQDVDVPPSGRPDLHPVREASA
jgi:hypothetical protein